MRADGSHPRVLARGPGLWGGLDFSPSGHQLLFRQFSTGPAGVESRLRTVDLTTGTIETLPVRGNPLAAAWAPDGKRIAYLWEPRSRALEGVPATELWTMRPDGTHRRRQLRLTHHRWADAIAWQPRH